LLKQRKNKTFNYKPRLSNQSESKDELIEDSEANSFATKWQRERSGNLSKGKRGFSMRTLILILVLLLICMYILENKYM
jgi:hypothetical protein